MKINSAASYLVFLSYLKGAQPFTPLKLQKLLYLAQGWSFRWDNRALFPEYFEAWTYGPVNIEVYHRFKRYGRRPIPASEGGIPFDMTSDERETLEVVWEHYKDLSSSRLVDLTHNQAPWLNAYESSGVIENDAIRDYFQATY